MKPPELDAEQLVHSERLKQFIAAEVAQRGGWVDFSQFMAWALYAPSLGYYSAGAKKFGAMGDFVTAPEISTLFGRTLARQVAEVLSVAPGNILELGAGTGQLALQILKALEYQSSLPDKYEILEVSAHLQQVQKETLLAGLAPEVFERVVWLQAMPDQMQGVIIGNEVLDALPVHIVTQKEEGLFERGVAIEGGEFVWRDLPAVNAPLIAQAHRLKLSLGMTTEICLAATALIHSLAECLQRGAMLWIDYGFPRHEYYHPQRNEGTLMCHYRHFAHGDPFAYLGLQDITAHVDFTAIAEAGVAQDLQVLGYTSQAQFLINCGITDLLAQVSPSDIAAYLPLATQAQKLISPAEMGELFKVIVLGRGLEASLMGFHRGDKTHQL